MRRGSFRKSHTHYGQRCFCSGSLDLFLGETFAAIITFFKVRTTHAKVRNEVSLWNWKQKLQAKDR